MSEEIKTYSPPVTDIVALGVEGAGPIEETKINQKVIIQRIAKDLYKGASSGLRELYMNSVRACGDAVELGVTKKPLITITMNEDERTLIIEDNGIGISEEMYQKVLRELGTSSNLSGKVTGQFGMGFASYMTLSSVVIIDTLALNEESFQRIAKDGMSFQKVGNGERKSHGTTLSMTCYNEVDFDELLETAQRIARYSGITTVLELDGFDYYGRFHAGTNKVHQQHYNDEAKEMEGNNHNIVDIETEDFHLIGVISGASQAHNQDHVFLLNVPIESSINVPFTWWVCNIKNERDFQPMPDRDRMRDESDKKLIGLIDAELKKYFLTLDITTYKQFLDSDRKFEFLWLCRHNEYARVPMHEMLGNLLDCQVRKVVYGTKNFGDGNLVDKLNDNPEVIYQGYKNRLVSEKLTEFCPDSLALTTKKSKRLPWRQSVQTMEDFGIPSAKAILIQHKVKLPKKEKGELEIIGHIHDKGYETEVIDFDSIDESYIRIDDRPVAEVLQLIRHVEHPYTFTRNAVELDETDCRDYSDWIKEIPNIVCATNKGAMTVGELIETNDKPLFWDDYDEKYVSFVKDVEETVVYGTDELLAYLIELNPDLNEFHRPSSFYNTKGLQEFINDKYDVNIWDDKVRAFFCDHLKEVPACYHELFGKTLENGDSELKSANYNLEIIKNYKVVEDDDIAKLEFYYNASLQMADDDDSDLGNVLSGMLSTVKSRIKDNEYLMTRFVKEMLLPQIFGKIVFRKCNHLIPNYETIYSTEFVSYASEFDFNDDKKVYDFDVKIRGLKLKFTKAYRSIKLEVVIN